MKVQQDKLIQKVENSQSSFKLATLKQLLLAAFPAALAENETPFFERNELARVAQFTTTNVQSNLYKLQVQGRPAKSRAAFFFVYTPDVVFGRF